MMVKMRMLQSMAGPDVSYVAGDIIEIPAANVAEWVAARIAEVVEEIETATQPSAPERAARTRAK